MDQRKDTHALVSQIRSGDRNAFRTLVDQHKRLVSHVIFRATGHIPDHEDLCQDVFLKVYQNIHKFREDAKLSTWIAQIAYNTSINYLRKKKPSLFENDAAILTTFKDEVEQPDVETERKDVSSRIADAIEQLPVQMRTIVTLYHLEEMSYKEICGIMRMPEGTVKSYLFRARKNLKKLLIKKFEPEDIQS